jgi:hypothetical protein
MNRQLFFVLLSTSLMLGCASARMYPVRGPWASESPPAVYPAKSQVCCTRETLKSPLQIAKSAKGIGRS